MSEVTDLNSPTRPTRPTLAGRRRSGRGSLVAAAGVAALALLGTACSSSAPDEPVAKADSEAVADDTVANSDSEVVDNDPTPATSEGERNSDGVLLLTATLTGEGPAEDPACTPEPGRQVDEHPDKTFQERTLPGAYEPETLLPDGRVMPAVDLPQITIPAHTVDGGCTVTYDAPAGCLGKVEITGVAIPTIEIPGYSYAEIDSSSDRVSTKAVAPRVIEGSAVESQVVEQTCEPGADGSIDRPSVQRPEVTRQSLYLQGATVSVRCSGVSIGTTTTTVAGSTCPEPILIDGMSIASMRFSPVTVKAATIESSELASGTEVLEAPERTSYVAPAAVLFDTAEHALKPEATAALAEILEQIEDGPSSAEITVDGHTDDVGDETDNQVLSERRAEAVAAWLVSNGIDEGRITTTGYGETVPAATGTTEAARAHNRRVVISVID